MSCGAATPIPCLGIVVEVGEGLKLAAVVGWALPAAHMPTNGTESCCLCRSPAGYQPGDIEDSFVERKVLVYGITIRSGR